ncbi:MAG: hypothetical protein K6E17_02400 [Clostridiales bacterium]|nr:hypothetical protein [Clostridiales bacterium]
MCSEDRQFDPDLREITEDGDGFSVTWIREDGRPVDFTDPESLGELEDIDLEGLDIPDLKRILGDLAILYARLEGMEPDDEDSDEYDEWQENLELVDDLMDGIHERIDDLTE